MRLTFNVKQYMIKDSRIDFVISFDIRKDIRMKTLVVTVCMLAIIIMVHGFDEERYYKFQMNLCRCSKERIVRDPNETQEYVNASLLKCAFGMDGALYGPYGHYDLYRVNEMLEDIIKDEESIEKAKNTFGKCFIHVSFQKSSRWMTNVEYISHCSNSILSLIE
ncbi:uncharacterized protein LOC116853065 [Odontomachus brunneus]|uniref:uncharacterized protein LOC116853065 n=1 Tax=Odontomachus brunneus TaxID=486640 RepID=UPI0013F1D1B9|nr:uncharacterized protein LOC116853065 [Odontomachus brunneus]